MLAEGRGREEGKGYLHFSGRFVGIGKKKRKEKTLPPGLSLSFKTPQPRKGKQKGMRVTRGGGGRHYVLVVDPFFPHPSSPSLLRSIKNQRSYDSTQNIALRRRRRQGRLKNITSTAPTPHFWEGKE
jgi:hypothetical protein